MSSVLDSIIEGVKEDVEQRRIPVAQLLEKLSSAEPVRDAFAALSTQGTSVIAEVKRSSPSKGDLAQIPDPARLASEYKAGGASVISVLTEQRRFKGSIADFEAVRAEVDLPLLRKDFIVTEYQVIESRVIGADLQLLIVAGLSKTELRDFYQMSYELGMNVLVEIHNEQELEAALDIDAKIIGINSRNLKTLEVDSKAFDLLLPLIPAGKIKVAESGIATRLDVAHIEELGGDAILVGEKLVKAANPTIGIQTLLGRDCQDSQMIEDFLGHFGPYGGRFVPEALINALDELTAAHESAKNDPVFQSELSELHRTYTGRPSIITEVKRFAEHAGGARIFLKREDLNHTGSHKINNVLGQALLTKRMGKKRIIAETGAGQHGVASATAAALMGLECVVYMGEDDTKRQSLNVARMKLLGAQVVPVTQGSRTLKDAINEAMRDWVTNVETTHYLLGTVAGPHPFPTMVRDFHRVIGVEARAQMLQDIGRLPDAVLACVGGGSNAIGIFHPFIDDKNVRLIGLEAGGSGIASGKHASTISGGTPGVLHGTRTYVLQDENGQTVESHSISAGLDYPGVGPEHAYLHDIGRAEYRSITDAEAMNAFKILCETEGIIPAIETAHALAGAMDIGKELGKDAVLLLNLSGRGDKDVQTAAEYFGIPL